MVKKVKKETDFETKGLGPGPQETAKDPFTVHVTMKVETRFEDRLDRSTEAYLKELDLAVKNAEALPGKGDVNFARKVDSFRSTVQGLKRELLDRVDSVKQCSIVLGKVSL